LPRGGRRTFQARLDGALSNLTQLKMSLLVAGWLDWMASKGPFQPGPVSGVGCWRLEAERGQGRGQGWGRGQGRPFVIGSGKTCLHAAGHRFNTGADRGVPQGLAGRFSLSPSVYSIVTRAVCWRNSPLLSGFAKEQRSLSVTPCYLNAAAGTAGKMAGTHLSGDLLFYHYRITESQNSRGWKGPLWVI